MTLPEGVTAFDRIRLDKAAVDEGYGIRRGSEARWLIYESNAAPATLRLTTDTGKFVVATNHFGVCYDLATRWEGWTGEVPTGFAAFVVADTAPLHHLIREVWRSARSLPIEPLRTFEAQTRHLPRNTEAERLVVQRVGQDIFRQALLDYWGASCAVLGVSEPRLLRASHIKPWKDCETDAERLDVYNGLLLSAHLDAAFDAFLISFEDDGRIIISARISHADCTALGLRAEMRLTKLAPAHLGKLGWHRSKLVALAEGRLGA